MKRKRLIPTIIWAALILVLTSIPVPDSVAMTAPGGMDKVVHFALYAVLGFLMMSAFWRPDTPWRSAATVMAAVAIFAAFDELHQLFIPGRGASAADWLADVAGAGAGVVLAALRATRREWQS